MLLHHIIHLLVTAVAVLAAARIVPGIRVRSFGSAVVFAFVLAVLLGFRVLTKYYKPPIASSSVVPPR